LETRKPTGQSSHLTAGASGDARTTLEFIGFMAATTGCVVTTSKVSEMRASSKRRIRDSMYRAWIGPNTSRGSKARKRIMPYLTGGSVTSWGGGLPVLKFCH
jgi:hypothetical protein